MIIHTACTFGSKDSGKTSFIKALISNDECNYPFADDCEHLYNLSDAKSLLIFDYHNDFSYFKKALSAVFTSEIIFIIISCEEGLTKENKSFLETVDYFDSKQVIIVLTRFDQVSNDSLINLKKDIRAYIGNKRINNSIMIEVDSVTGKGISAINSALQSIVSVIPIKNNYSPPRLYLDKIINNDDGTVSVEGNLLSGQISVGDILEITPINETVTVQTLINSPGEKNIQRVGERLKINIGNIDSDNLYRGCCLIKSGIFKATNNIDCEITLHACNTRILKNKQKVRLSMMTNNLSAKVYLLNKPYLTPGSTAYVRIHTYKHLTTRFYDKIVLLNRENDSIIAVGQILRVRPDDISCYDINLLNILDAYRDRNYREVVINYLKCKTDSVEIKTITDNLPYLELDLIERLHEENIITLFSNKVILTEDFEKLKNRIVTRFKRLHKVNPHKVGYTPEYISKTLNLNLDLTQAVFFYLLKETVIKCKYNTYSLAKHTIKRSMKERILMRKLSSLLKRQLFIDTQALKLLDLETSLKLLSQETDLGNVIEISDKIFMSPENLEIVMQKIKRHIEQHNQITPAECRDLLDSSRKFIIPLLEYLDKISFTKRTNGSRELA